MHVSLDKNPCYGLHPAPTPKTVMDTHAVIASESKLELNNINNKTKLTTAMLWKGATCLAPAPTPPPDASTACCCITCTWR